MGPDRERRRRRARHAHGDLPGRQRETHLPGIERANAAIEAASTRLKRPEVLGVPEPNSRDFVLSGAAGAGAGFLRYHRNDHLFQDLMDLDGSGSGRSEALRAAWRELLTFNVPLAASDRDVVLASLGAGMLTRTSFRLRSNSWYRSSNVNTLPSVSRQTQHPQPHHSPPLP